MHDIMPNYTYISIVVLFYGNYISRANKSRCLMQYGLYTNEFSQTSRKHELKFQLIQFWI